MENEHHISHLANYLINAFDKPETISYDRSITVNPVVSQVASWYEKLRNVMEYGEEEVVLRVTIQRILKRRMLLGGTGEKVALPLVRELLWAKYFSVGSIPEATIAKVAHSIDLHIALKNQVIEKHSMDEGKLNQWIVQLLSVDILYLLNQDRRRDVMANFMFQIMKKLITITDDKPETRDAQVFIAVRRAFARDDRALLRYHLFKQYFGQLTKENIESVSTSFMKGYNEIEREFSYPLKEKIYSYVRQQTPVFFILQDILLHEQGKFKTLISSPEELSQSVIAACEVRYKSIASKVRRAIIRAVFFILLTKVVFAFVIEGSYEKARYGHIMWGTLIVNTGIPPLLMVVVGLLIRTPGLDNSRRILSKIQVVLFSDDPKISQPLLLTKAKQKQSLMDYIFTILWMLAFLLSFGGIWFLLGKFHFNYLSRIIFMFFVAIVSFLSYRINQTANMYAVESKQSLLTPLIDFIFLPIIQVGRRLTEGVAQINIFLFILDFVFETPFKGLFAFFEQWFHYLHQKRENLE